MGGSAQWFSSEQSEGSEPAHWAGNSASGSPGARGPQSLLRRWRSRSAVATQSSFPRRRAWLRRPWWCCDQLLPEYVSMAASLKNNSFTAPGLLSRVRQVPGNPVGLNRCLSGLPCRVALEIFMPHLKRWAGDSLSCFRYPWRLGHREAYHADVAVRRARGPLHPIAAAFTLRGA